MSDTITQEELKDAIAEWAPKFNLIRELWPGASIEESLSLMSVIEERAEEIRDEKKNAMGFGSYVDNKSKKLKNKVQANSPYNDGWTQEFFRPDRQDDAEESQRKALEGFKKPTLTRCKPKKNTREF